MGKAVVGKLLHDVSEEDASRPAKLQRIEEEPTVIEQDEYQPSYVGEKAHRYEEIV